MRVFLSHSSAQRRDADRIVAKLRSRNFEVFYSADRIPPGESFDSIIVDEIRKCDAMIFLVSAQSVANSYARTELDLARKRWANPRNRVLGVLVGDVPIDSVPDYLRENVNLLLPRGEFVTEVANAMVEMRSRRRRRIVLPLVNALTAFLLALGGGYWHFRASTHARLDTITRALIQDALDAPQYFDTCVTKLETFSKYEHRFKKPENCDARRVAGELSPPLLVVAQTGYGKKGFMQLLRGAWAKQGRPAVLVSYRDCLAGRPRSAPVELEACLVQSLSKETMATVDDARAWLGDRSRYIVMFDAVDDSASRVRVIELIRALWQHHEGGGSVVLSSQPENLSYVLARYGIEAWSTWVHTALPSVDVRGINVNSVQRLATDYDEHRVDADAIRMVLDFPQQCPPAKAVLQEWVAQPKLFRGQGTKTVLPMVEEIKKLGPDCQGWRGGVLTAMLRARLWSYCHDELCNYQVEGEKYIDAAKWMRDEGTVNEARLAILAKVQGLRDADELAFALLSTGPLYYESGQLKMDPAWIPE